MKIRNLFLFTGLLLLSSIPLNAQFSAGAQLRTRSEFRNGQGAPLSSTANPAFFTSQRTRLILGYTAYRLKMGLTLQDVRVWGQDVSTINRTTATDYNGTILHEAWAEIMLSDTTYKKGIFSLKFGRQELMYDDSRLLGNLDWLQQGRRHDAAVLKFDNPKYMFHLGVAYNQNKELSSGTLYNNTPPGTYTSSTNGGAMYKGMQYLYAAKKLKDGIFSLLFFTDQFNKFHTEVISGTSTKVPDLGLWARSTTGFYFNKTIKNISATASGYYQFGKNSTGQVMNAYMYSGVAMYNIGKKLGVGAGYDYTSGGSAANVFDPLYGTPHKFWGFMDYYYVASGFGKSGLQDIYLKSKWKLSEKCMLLADAHQFFAASDVYAANNVTKLDKNFGTEIDLVATCQLTKIIGFELGYSHYFTTSTLTSLNVKNVANSNSNSNWAYLMLIIKPDFLSK